MEEATMETVDLTFGFDSITLPILLFGRSFFRGASVGNAPPCPKARFSRNRKGGPGARGSWGIESTFGSMKAIARMFP
ncbi:unnamed protein product [Victoria cruziana]